MSAKTLKKKVASFQTCVSSGLSSVKLCKKRKESVRENSLVNKDISLGCSNVKEISFERHKQSQKFPMRKSLTCLFLYE